MLSVGEYTELGKKKPRHYEAFLRRIFTLFETGYKHKLQQHAPCLHQASH